MVDILFVRIIIRLRDYNEMLPIIETLHASSSQDLKIQKYALGKNNK